MGRAADYLKELQFCARAGAGFGGKYALSAAALSFHWANYRKQKAGGAPKCFRINTPDGVRELWLRPTAGDMFIFLEVFQLHTYAIPEHFRSGVTRVLDLGGNIGLASLYMSTLLPDAEFLCVEPAPANLELLRRNMDAWKLKTRVSEHAVAMTAGWAEFDFGPGAWGGKLGSAQGGIKVKTAPVEQILAEQKWSGAHVLKIDVEGMERHLFTGPAPWLNETRLMLIELHPPYTEEQFRKEISALGFRVVLPGQEGFNILAAVRE